MKWIRQCVHFYTHTVYVFENLVQLKLWWFCLPSPVLPIWGNLNLHTVGLFTQNKIKNYDRNPPHHAHPVMTMRKNQNCSHILLSIEFRYSHQAYTIIIQISMNGEYYNARPTDSVCRNATERILYKIKAKTNEWLEFSSFSISNYIKTKKKPADPTAWNKPFLFSYIFIYFYYESPYNF